MNSITKLLACSALCLSPALANANLIVNGDFENPAINSGTWTTFYGNSLPGWTAGTHGIELRNSVAGHANTGSQYVELDTNANSSMSQSFTTTANQSYTFSFAYSPRFDVPASSNGIAVYWDNTLIASITGNGIGNNDNVWKMFSFNEIATSSTSSIEFAAIGTSDSYGGSLDTVSVTANVPESGPLALLTIGLIGLGFARRRA